MHCPGPAEVAAAVREAVESCEAPFCVSKTGTFGVSSAPHWWSKLFATIERFVGHVMQVSVFWHLVYVDDLHGAFTGERKFDWLWIWLPAFEVIGTPFGYHKFKGGFSSDFLGFHLRYDKNEGGIRVKRGTWLVNWIRALEEKRFVVPAKEFSEFLGRLGFVAQLLTWLKSSLAPLYNVCVGIGVLTWFGWEAAGHGHFDVEIYSC